MNEPISQENNFMLTTTDNPYSPKTEYEKWWLYDVGKGYSTLENIERIKNVLKEYYATNTNQKYTDDELEIMAKDKILTLGPIRNYKKLYYDAQGNLIDSQK